MALGIKSTTACLTTLSTKTLVPSFFEILSKAPLAYERRAGRESSLIDSTTFVILGPSAVL